MFSVKLLQVGSSIAATFDRYEFSFLHVSEVDWIGALGSILWVLSVLAASASSALCD